jgi:hypothetical protein
MKSRINKHHIIFAAAILLGSQLCIQAMVALTQPIGPDGQPINPQRSAIPSPTIPRNPNFHWQQNTNGFRGSNGFFYRAPAAKK